MKVKETFYEEMKLIKVERDEWRNIAHRMADVIVAAGCETYPTYQYFLELLERFPTPVGDGKQK